MQLAKIRSSFAELVETGAMDSAYERWSNHSPVIASLNGPANLIDAVTDSKQSIGEHKNRVIDALCEFATEGDQPAAVLLLWLFAGAFRNIQKEVGDCPLSAEELESEMTAAFWEAVACRKGSEKLAGRLYYRVLQATWRAVRKARAEACRRAELHPDIMGLSDKCADPSYLVLEAVRQGAIDQVGAELILATRVDGSSIGKVAPSFRLSPEAAGMRRSRAERALVAFWPAGSRATPWGRPLASCASSSLRQVLVASSRSSSPKSASRKCHALGIGPLRCLLKGAGSTERKAAGHPPTTKEAAMTIRPLIRLHTKPERRQRN